MKMMHLRIFTTTLLLCMAALPGRAQIASQRAQAAIMDELIGDRLTQLLPTLMDAHNIDMWILICREYNEDPVVKTMLPPTWLSARRRTILVFYRHKPSGIFERAAIARYNVGTHIKSIWDWQRYPNQWDALHAYIREKNPARIGINTSVNFGHADGLAHTDYTLLLQGLENTYQKRMVSAEALAVDWLQTRTAKELQYYGQLVNFTHRLIAEAFSEKVITPGITTTEDVVWYMRQYITDHGLTAWFHPTVDVQRGDAGNREFQRSFSERPGNEVIRPGDLLHCDVGITYLGLNTDIQQLAYVLPPGEKEAPLFLQEALATGNRLQDILTSQMQPGTTGNTALKAALAQAKAEGINPSIYSHPIGLHGHAAGPAIGMWDMQEGVPGTGDYVIKNNTCYSIELNASVYLESWERYIRVMLEENACLAEGKLTYLNGRQLQLHLIPRQKAEIGQ